MTKVFGWTKPNNICFYPRFFSKCFLAYNILSLLLHTVYVVATSTNCNFIYPKLITWHSAFIGSCSQGWAWNRWYYSEAKRPSIGQHWRITGGDSGRHAPPSGSSAWQWWSTIQHWTSYPYAMTMAEMWTVEWSEEQDQVEKIGKDWSVLEFLQLDESVKKVKHNLHMSLHLGFKGQMQ